MQLTKRQQQIFDMFLDAPSEPRTISDFAELGAERTTIFRDVKKLVQADLLRQTGKSPPASVITTSAACQVTSGMSPTGVKR
ncbi:hypothetical protein RDV39_002782 [Salmonella enterica]|nr:hypothetical protein [Salmonella enterica]